MNDAMLSVVAVAVAVAAAVAAVAAVAVAVAVAVAIAIVVVAAAAVVIAGGRVHPSEAVGNNFALPVIFVAVHGFQKSSYK